MGQPVNVVVNQAIIGLNGNPLSFSQRNGLQGIRENNIQFLNGELGQRYLNDLAYWRIITPDEIDYSNEIVPQTGMRIPMINRLTGQISMTYSQPVRNMMNFGLRAIREYFRLKDKYLPIYTNEHGIKGTAYLFNLLLKFLLCYSAEYTQYLSRLKSNSTFNINTTREDEEYFLTCDINKRSQEFGDRTRVANVIENEKQTKKMEKKGGKKKKATTKKK